MDTSQIGKRAWGYAGVLQDAGLSCFEYVEQLTLLLFLKMADQLTEEPHNKPAIVPQASKSHSSPVQPKCASMGPSANDGSATRPVTTICAPARKACAISNAPR